MAPGGRKQCAKQKCIEADGETICQQWHDRADMMMMMMMMRMMASPWLETSTWWQMGTEKQLPLS